MAWFKLQILLGLFHSYVAEEHMRIIPGVGCGISTPFKFIDKLETTDVSGMGCTFVKDEVSFMKNYASLIPRKCDTRFWLSDIYLISNRKAESLYNLLLQDGSLHASPWTTTCPAVCNGVDSTQVDKTLAL